nr:fumarylacetoacetate hydrolase family protein [Glutamicibacter halophytocola]
MKLATIRTVQGHALAREAGDELLVYPFSSVSAWLEAGSPELVEGEEVSRVSPQDADFAPVVPAPGKIICVGLNYREHILEMGRDLPQRPTLFAKYADALIGANDDIVLPPNSDAVDWEAELAIVIGRTVSRASSESAAEAIAGFTVANDISARDFQRFTPQWLQGKTFDDTTPLGPYLITADEVGVNPDLLLECLVDNETKQSSQTADLVFGPTELVRYISEITTLRAGDIILTGTPGGVGDGRSPKEFLGEGSVVTTSIAGIGTCRNTCATR